MIGSTFILFREDGHSDRTLYCVEYFCEEKVGGSYHPSASTAPLYWEYTIHTGRVVWGDRYPLIRASNLKIQSAIDWHVKSLLVEHILLNNGETFNES